MERARLLELVVELGGEFSRREMTEHYRHLRIYYLAVRHELDVRGDVQLQWDAGMVQEWMKILRLPPYQDDYPVQTGSSCLRCTEGQGQPSTMTAFPGGAKMHCRTCSAVWLVLHQPEP